MGFPIPPTPPAIIKLVMKFILKFFKMSPWAFFGLDKPKEFQTKGKRGIAALVVDNEGNMYESLTVYDNGTGNSKTVICTVNDPDGLTPSAMDPIVAGSTPITAYYTQDYYGKNNVATGSTTASSTMTQSDMDTFAGATGLSNSSGADLASLFDKSKYERTQNLDINQINYIYDGRYIFFDSTRMRDYTYGEAGVAQPDMDLLGKKLKELYFNNSSVRT